jgi:hypothetical protein
MIGKRFACALVLAGTSALVGWGCGVQANVPQPDRNLALQDVADLYRLYVETNKKPPQNVQDFARYEQGMPSGYWAIKRGNVVVQWGANLSDTSGLVSSSDSADEVLAYEKNVPTEGGDVLMKNRTIKRMTADEFKSATKASPSK